jgi:hypothetical protein
VDNKWMPCNHRLLLFEGLKYRAPIVADVAR